MYVYIRMMSTYVCARVAAPLPSQARVRVSQPSFGLGGGLAARICMHMHAYACISRHIHAYARLCMHMHACICSRCLPCGICVQLMQVFRC